ncbi:MAG: hypothetical protein A3H98_13560 [Bacteroidetes bacterium RIFCSPLOWO2_02_FULL_36_8]|nr:MAG: hypothetical protein A3H98_13560 [Bacteroidetes bacterium RIFCSPLOWO2_02_FULL_36_8]OFY70650.1 MAG: hypothetical protein A3G23_07935 [Bacteroidetes bacterium RIFCSPLOWO2_12_FULL_37_12]
MKSKIFISSRMNYECQEERLFAEKVFRTEGYSPVLFESEPPDSKHIINWWREKIKESDFFVSILDQTLSAAVFDEFKEAVKENKKMLVFIKDYNKLSEQKLEIINCHELQLFITESELIWFYRKIKSIKFEPYKSLINYYEKLISGIRQYDQRNGIPENLWKYYIYDDDSEFQRINEVYVKPKQYDIAEEFIKRNKFLIIIGSANIGKTSLALFLSSKILQYFNLSSIFKIENEHILNIKNIKNSVIILDDVFGKSELKTNYVNDFEAIIRLKENNFVILTSRENLLLELTRTRNRFSEYSNSELEPYFIKLEQEGTYSNMDLKNILENHINYYVNNGTIKRSDTQITFRNKERIISELRFPHNYELFVREQLSKFSKGEVDIDRAIENAKHIKREAKNWFLTLDINKKVFILLIYFFQGIKPKIFNAIYTALVQKLKERHISLNLIRIDDLKNMTSHFVTVSDTIRFRHSNYLEGVSEGIRDNFLTETEMIFSNLKLILYPYLKRNIFSLYYLRKFTDMFLVRPLVFVFLSFTSPLIWSIGILIKLESKGPTIYRQIRIRSDGKPILCIKFRTVTIREYDKIYSNIDKPEVTKVGQFLRRTGLANLPLIFNVLKGDLSIFNMSETYKVKDWVEYLPPYKSSELIELKNTIRYSIPKFYALIPEFTTSVIKKWKSDKYSEIREIAMSFKV